MKILQKKYASGQWQVLRDDLFDHASSSLVFIFGSTALLQDPALYSTARDSFPKAQILMNSTAGEIIDTQVNDQTLSLTAILLEKTEIKSATGYIDNAGNSYAAGKALGASLDHKGLNNVIIISDGQKVNGSELVSGLQDALPESVIITGGLAGDGTRFKSTLVGLNESPMEGRLAAIGFYGGHLNICYGSVGGWNSFGHERLITKSSGNILYELDGKPALEIYKSYLGDYAKDLPSSALLFPLSVRPDNGSGSVVRTILSISEKDKSLTFAGNMPEGSYARLMKANSDRLIEGASDAAQHTLNQKNTQPELAILISCIGRKLVLDQRIEEEVEIVRAVYGQGTAIAGFYSYGEISPTFNFMKCDLHNQTMTITTISEN